MGTVLRGFILYMIFTYFLATPTCYGLYEKFLFYPSNQMLEPVQIKNTECQALSIRESGGTEISAWYYKKSPDAGLVLVSHGNAGNISHRCELAAHLLKDTDCSVLLYDYQGYGASQGRPGVKAILADGLAAFDYAVEKLNYSSDSIILYGESLGCAVSCVIASKRKAKGLILQSGFRSLPAIAGDVLFPLKIMPGFMFPEPKLDSEKLLQGEHPPVLVMHGRHDEVIPFRHGQILYQRASQPKTFVPLENSGHNDTFMADRELFDRSIANFVQMLDKRP